MPEDKSKIIVVKQEQKNTTPETPATRDSAGNPVEELLVDDIELSLGLNLGRNTLIVRS